MVKYFPPFYIVEKMSATIRLFKSVLIKTKKKKKATKELLEKTIKKGFIFSPEVISNYSEKELLNMVDVVDKEIGLTADQMNSSFHKSWKKIRDASIEQLVIEQVMHYMTTYGFEELNCFSHDTVYIPKEKLDVPKLEDDIKLVVIKGYTKEDIKEKLLNMLCSGVALSEQSINDVKELLELITLTIDEIGTIRNKEVQAIVYERYDLVPENPVDFLRYVIYKITGKTLLIKSKQATSSIKATLEEIPNREIIGLFMLYHKMSGLKKLATIFYRFKPLFLAFRGAHGMKPIINTIRRLALKHHKPMPEDYLNSITAKIKKNEIIDMDTLQEELDNVNTFRKIRLAYALKFRTKECDSILYKVRSGKGFVTEFKFEQYATAKKILGFVVDSIVKDIRKNVKGKKIYIPENMTYMLPATEKQFTGNFPSGSYVTVPKDMIVGIHWNNVDEYRIDLDLSLMNPEIGKIGWDAGYRTQDRSILFTGDLTDAPAPNGASELFYVKRQLKSGFIMYLNYFNFNANVEVPYKIIVAREQVNNFEKNYVLNPNNVVTIAKSSIDVKQKILGLLVTTTKECRYYFAETDIGNSIAANTIHAEQSRKYLFNFFTNMITLNDILVQAGAKIVDETVECDISLAPNDLEKDSILNLLIKND